MGLRDRLAASALASGLLLFPASCVHQSAPLRPVADALTLERLESSETAALGNLLQVTDRVYSGGEPRGPAGFDALARLGVELVVSVDGARPDVEAARHRGMRYVHVPIGYDGVPARSALALTRVLREFDGRAYFHCHRGQHRGPAAVAIACIGAGITDRSGAVAILDRAGTSHEYAGLWRAVKRFKAPPLEAKLPELVEIAEVMDYAAAMAAVGRATDNLERCAEAGWRTPARHPDLSPAQEALLLWEGLRESRRTTIRPRDARFEQWLAEGERLAKDLRADLAGDNREAATLRFKQVQKSCKTCHAKYRDRWWKDPPDTAGGAP